MLSTFHNYASINSNIGGGAIRPLPVARKNSTETQQSNHNPRSGLEVKMKEVMPNMARRETRMRDNPEEGDLGPADDVRRKNFSSVLSCIDNKTKEGCNRGSEVGKVNSERNEKDQFL